MRPDLRKSYSPKNTKENVVDQITGKRKILLNTHVSHEPDPLLSKRLDSIISNEIEEQIETNPRADTET